MLIGFLPSEFSAPVRRPSFDDHFLIREKINCVAALRMEVAKEAVFPAGEGEVGHGGGNAQINTDVPGPDFMAELPGCTAAGGEEAGHVAIGRAVDHLDRVIQGRSPNHAQYGAKYFRTRQVTTRIDV